MINVSTSIRVQPQSDSDPDVLAAGARGWARVGAGWRSDYGAGYLSSNRCDSLKLVRVAAAHWEFACAQLAVAPRRCKLEPPADDERPGTIPAERQRETLPSHTVDVGSISGSSGVGLESASARYETQFAVARESIGET